MAAILSAFPFQFNTFDWIELNCNAAQRGHMRPLKHDAIGFLFTVSFIRSLFVGFFSAVEENWNDARPKKIKNKISISRFSWNRFISAEQWYDAPILFVFQTSNTRTMHTEETTILGCCRQVES